MCGKVGPMTAAVPARNRRLHALRMMGREHASDEAAERQPDHDRLARRGLVHDGQRVGHAILQRIRPRAVRPVGLAVARDWSKVMQRKRSLK